MIIELEEQAGFADVCRTLLGNPDQWVEPVGYQESVALCIIDSIQSTGPTYTSVINVVTRYRQYRAAQGASAEHDGTLQLINTFTELGGVDAWAKAIGNKNRTYSRKTAPLKAEAIFQAAERVADQGITSMEQLRQAIDDDSLRNSLRTAWLGVVSQSSGITWDYFLMLVGEPGVKADRMVIRFVERALKRRAGSVSVETTKNTVAHGARQLGVSITALDHAIWRFESGRSNDAGPA